MSFGDNMHKILVSSETTGIKASMSSNGFVQYVILSGISTAKIRKSIDGGITWADLNILGITSEWTDIKCSSDGLKVIVGHNAGKIYQSSDGGDSWAEKLLSIDGNGISSVAISEDGIYRAATVSNGIDDGIYQSNNNGVSWTSSSHKAKKLVMSGSGEIRFFICPDTNQVYPPPNYVYQSTNYGASWSPMVNAGEKTFYDISLSADGNKGLLTWLTNDLNNILELTGSPGTFQWNSITGIPSRTWRGVGVSPDGQNLIATSTDNISFKSIDSGNSWSSISYLPSCKEVIISSNNNYILAIPSLDGIPYRYREYGNSPMQFGVNYSSTSIAFRFQNFKGIIQKNNEEPILFNSNTQGLTINSSTNFSVWGTATGIIGDVNGNIPAIANLNSITSWGGLGLQQITYLTNSTVNFTVPNDLPNTVTSFYYMFYNAIGFNQNLNTWDTSNVTDMRSVFSKATAFNGLIDSWNTSNVTDMSYMFGGFGTGAQAFNKPIGDWNVSNVTDMSGMFWGTSAFNQPLRKWNVSNSNLTGAKMASMFRQAYSFNQNLTTWDVERIDTEPANFDLSASNWEESKKPLWGQAPSPLNSIPINMSLSSTSISEGQPIGILIGTFSTEDPDNPDDVHTYSLVAGDTSAFIINGNQLLTNAVFDYETQSSYSITVRSTDQGGLTFEKTFSISINNVNEAPSAIFISNSWIQENNSFNAVIATISSNGTGTIIYSLPTVNDNQYFSITGNQLLANTVFNYENKTSYSIIIKASATSGEYYEQPFTINISNVNEGPTITSEASVSFAENATGTVYTVTATDPDAGTTLVYGISGTDAASFNVDFNTGAVTFIAPPNFEDQESYSIVVSASDGFLTDTKAVTISITNVTEAPSDISLSSSSIVENAGVIKIADISGIGGVAPFVFTLVLGEGDTDNSLFLIQNQNELWSTSSFDYEQATERSIRIQAASGGEVFAKSFTISITNVAEAPLDISLSSSSIIENAGAIKVANISGTGGVAPFVFTLVSGEGADDNASFNINQNELWSTSSFDYEQATERSIRIQAASGGEVFAKSFTINITNVNETVAPTVQVNETPPINNLRPTWSWTSGGGDGAGYYRYGYSEGTWIEEDVTSTSFTPGSDLSEGSHTLYVQERNSSNMWSLSGFATVIVDTTVPTITRIAPEASTNVVKSTNIAFTISDNIEVDWNTLQVTIAGTSAIANNVAQSGYTLSRVDQLITINPDQDFEGGANIAVNISIEDASSNLQILEFSFTTQSDTSIDVPTTISGATSLGTLTNPAAINASITVANTGELTLNGSSTAQIEINAPITIQSGGHFILPQGLDSIKAPAQPITLLGGATYTMGTRTRTVRPGTKLVIKKTRG